MTIVLAHGVPEVAALWDGLRTHLGRTDVATVALPGFGTPRPRRLRSHEGGVRRLAGGRARRLR